MGDGGDAAHQKIRRLRMQVPAESLKLRRQQNRVCLIDLLRRIPSARPAASERSSPLSGASLTADRGLMVGQSRICGIRSAGRGEGFDEGAMRQAVVVVRSRSR